VRDSLEPESENSADRDSEQRHLSKQLSSMRGNHLETRSSKSVQMESKE
jgi:hypothetical protein